jgi:hypothetical protein
MFRIACASFTALALAACATVPRGADTNPPPTVPPPVPSSALCPVQYSNSWRAWVDAMPGPNGTGPTLHVIGIVKSLNGRGSVALRPTSQVMESDPVKVTVDLAEIPGGTTNADSAVEQTVSGSWRSARQVGSVTVRCLDTTLATISAVETAY